MRSFIFAVSLFMARVASEEPRLQLCGSLKRLEGFSDFFNTPTAWQNLGKRLNSIKFFVGDVAAIPENVTGGYAAVAAMFNETGMTLDFEAGGLRGFNCNGTSYAHATVNMLRPLLQEPDFAQASIMVTFDGPFAHSLHQDTNTCSYTLSQVAQELVAHCTTIRTLLAQIHPEMQVSFTWNEPVPWYSVGAFPPYENGTHNDFGDLLELVDLVHESGVPFEAFHADHPPFFLESHGYEKLNALMKHVRGKGWRFGKYFNSQTGGATSDLSFENGTVKDVTDFVKLNGVPDDVIVESWYEYPHYALPETRAGALGHTALQVVPIIDGSLFLV